MPVNSVVFVTSLSIVWVNCLVYLAVVCCFGVEFVVFGGFLEFAGFGCLSLVFWCSIVGFCVWVCVCGGCLVYGGFGRFLVGVALVCLLSWVFWYLFWLFCCCGEFGCSRRWRCVWRFIFVGLVG